ncbi:FRIGIDA-like protein [Rhynchospora pubera]|uniref:FRIGIDA-like protein n=1 Tax=Rhynchospora pubera TaxID=906938 RepID=A0AAV8FKP2_9POAL|nr:FRIGIDA-like protein [Rhynchospora pubera]
MEDSSSHVAPTEVDVKMEGTEEEPKEEIREVNEEPTGATESKLTNDNPENSKTATEDSTNVPTDAGPAMKEAANPLVAIDPTTVMLEQLSTALHVLKSHTESSLEMQNSIQWDEIQSYFKKLDASFNARAEELDRKKAELEKKQARAQIIIKEKEVAIKEKERESWNKLQVVKDKAVSRIKEACEKHKVDVSELIHGRNRRYRAPARNPDESAPAVFSSLPDLKPLFEQMDSKGLVKFFSENHKKLSVQTEELGTAMKCAPDPVRLVLDILEEGFWYQVDAQVSVQDESENDKLSTLTGIRKCCITLMELLTSGGHAVSQEVSARAWAILAGWKQMLARLNLDVHNGCSMEAQAVLQLMATFNVTSVYDEDELCKLVVTISRCKHTIDLCRALGMTERISGIVEELISRKRPIDAVHFIQAFDLGEKFPVIPILTSHLEDPQDFWEYDAEKPMSQKDPNSKEIMALRAVIRVVEEYKLQKDLPVGPLHKRIAELRCRSGKRGATEPHYTKPFKKRGAMYPCTYPPAPRPSPPAVESSAYADPYAQYPTPPATGYATAYPHYPPPAEPSTSTPHYSSAPTYYGSYAGATQDPYSGYGSYVDPNAGAVPQPQPQAQPAGTTNYGSYASSGYPPPAEQSYM